MELWKKLNHKHEDEIWVLNAPPELLPVMHEAPCRINTLYDGFNPIGFALIFATQQAELNELIPHIAGMLEGDAILWIAYPKQSSKRYTCDFNRDTGWAILGAYKLEPVRQVAINEDWSALRFRKIEYIKNFTRKAKMALSTEGKTRASKANKTNIA
jgi:hypothetical protein